jgi:hypothetical protein
MSNDILAAAVVMASMVGYVPAWFSGRLAGRRQVYNAHAAAWEAGRTEQYAADLMGRDARPNPYKKGKR